MITKVIKRDGTEQNFSLKKLKKAIRSSFTDLNPSFTKEDQVSVTNIAKSVTESFHGKVDVETIQDAVEKHLMQEGYLDQAKQYILYRDARARARINTIDKTLQELVSGDSDYWNNENSNKNAKIVTTQRDYIAGITSTDAARRFILPKEVVEAHDAGIIHQHDMDYMLQSALHNCFSERTKFITNEGVKDFRHFKDGQEITVKDKDGHFRKAIVHSYGFKPMVDVELCYRGGRHPSKVITCTPDHRWYLQDGTVTTNLKVGDYLYSTADSRHLKFNEYDEKASRLFCLGFILGDGTDCTGYTRVRLCGSKNKYISLFEKAGYRRNADIENDSVFTTYEFSKQDLINGKFWRILTPEEKCYVFEGFYAADGRMKGHNIVTHDERLCTFIEEVADIAGYYIVSKTSYVADTSYKSGAQGWMYRFVCSNKINYGWFVKSITPRTKPLMCWCVEEPVTHSFMLDEGVATGNCDLISLKDMLLNGTVINGVAITAQHRLRTAATVATQIITAVSSSQYGGCTISLSHLAPFVKMSYDFHLNKYLFRGFEDDLAEKYAKEDLKNEITASVQTFNYQINSMSTTNGQAPFLSVAMYLTEEPEYESEAAMLIEEFLKQRIKGLPNELGVPVTQAFPKLLYFLDDNNVTPDSKYWYLTQLAAECTAKRMVPDYISVKVMKNLKGDAYPCMGCRSYLTPDRCTENWAKDKTYVAGKGKYYGRFNMGVTTLNLFDAALSSHKDQDEFWKILNERCELCHVGLKVRIDRLLSVTSDCAPILWQHGALARLDKGEKLTNLVHHGYATASLGYAGLYECVKYLTGESHTSEKGREFGLKVMQFLNDKCAEWKAAEDIDYSVYGTPIESTTYKFAKCLKKRFGDDVFEKLDGTDRNYITNSYHVPVFEEIDAFTKLKKESEFQKLSPGGAISYVECADLTHNLDAVIQVMQYIYDNIMYAELNTKSDYCHVCGCTQPMQIIDENNRLQYKCPNCGNEDPSLMNVARRVCGYISTTPPNQGRLDEFRNRYVHLDNRDDDE